MKVSVDDKCIGCGVCAVTAPLIFKVDGVPATVVKQPETPEEQSSYEEAKSSCPVGAIQ